MGMPKYGARRDDNEAELLDAARELGWSFWEINEHADQLGLFRRQWYIVEIKDPKKEGHADEYTDKQKEFHARVKERGGRILTWRTPEDIVRDSCARVGA